MADRADSGHFGVDLGGVIALLGRNLYSTPGVYLRELLQNAHDAVAARRAIDSSAPGVVRVVPADVDEPGSPRGVLTVTDSGIGLAADDLVAFLSTVGASSKRDALDLPREGFLGRFGIGLLSCFLVADAIRVESRRAGSDEVVEWVGTGDGRYSTRVLEGVRRPEGTTVTISPRPGEGILVESPGVLDLVARYAEFLPVALAVASLGGDREFGGPAPFLMDPVERPSDVLEFGERLIGGRPFAAVPLEVAATQSRGVAYILPASPGAAAEPVARVSLGGMLVSEQQHGVTPEWAFFARVVLDSRGLHPTASREAIVDDDALEQTRDEIGAMLRSWIVDLSTRDPVGMAAFIQSHGLALKLMALVDDGFARFIVRWLPVETTRGSQTIGDLLATGSPLLVAASVDDYRQAAPLIGADEVLINGGYTADLAVLEMLPILHPDAEVEVLEVARLLDQLTMPPAAEQAAADALALRAEAVLADRECDVAVRAFPRADPPAVIVVDPVARRRADRRRTRDRGLGGPWLSVLTRIDELMDADAAPRSKVFLNWSNPLVAALARRPRGVTGAAVTRILYVQALMAGFHPLTAQDRRELSTALADLLDLGVGLDPEESP